MSHGAQTARPHLDTFASVSLVVLASCAVGGLLWIGRAALVPVAFAMLLALVLSAPVEALHRHGISRGIAAIVVLLSLLLVAGLTLNAIWAPARAWLASVPQTIELVERRMGPVAGALENLVSETASGTPLAPGHTREEKFALSASDTLLVATPSALIATVTVLILTLFLLTGGAAMVARIAATLSSNGQAIKVLRVVEHVRSEVARYYVTVALINVGLGAATTLVTAVAGLPNPLLWGTMATVFNFVPYAGSASTLVVLSFVSLGTFESVGRVIAMIASFLVLVTIEGQIVEPLLIGRRLKLSPIVVFLALWFGGWFWGIAGMILALPGLVALKIVAEHSADGRVLVELLSPSPRRRSRPVQPTA